MRQLMLPLVLLIAPAVAVAQETPSTPSSVAFPGSVNMTVGNVTPTERGNVVSRSGATAITMRGTTAAR